MLELAWFSSSHSDDLLVCQNWWVRIHRASFFPGLGHSSSTLQYLVLVAYEVVQTVASRRGMYVRPMLRWLSGT